MSSSFDGRDLFGFDAEGTEFDADMTQSYDISADFVVPDDRPFTSFGAFDTMARQPADETMLVSLTYQGYVFAKRIVTIKRPSDPTFPLPFFFRDDVCSSSHTQYLSLFHHLFCVMSRDPSAFSVLEHAPLSKTRQATTQFCAFRATLE